jgi:hypothetical protein
MGADERRERRSRSGGGDEQPGAGGASSGSLEHTMGGRTTRDDPGDLGVPMQAGRPDEPVGPEDALGQGPKRGDYTGRIGPESYHPHEALPIPADEREDGGPTAMLHEQRPRAAEQGDAEGKGGVTTAA